MESRASCRESSTGRVRLRSRNGCERAAMLNSLASSCMKITGSMSGSGPRLVCGSFTTLLENINTHRQLAGKISGASEKYFNSECEGMREPQIEAKSDRGRSLRRSSLGSHPLFPSEHPSLRTLLTRAGDWNVEIDLPIVGIAADRTRRRNASEVCGGIRPGPVWRSERANMPKPPGDLVHYSGYLLWGR